jgi:hypothetical protein
MLMRYTMLVVLAACPPALAEVWFVDTDNISGVEDGLSWQTAFTTIQPAIDAAYSAGGGDVWVAEGVYDERRILVIDGVDRGSLDLRGNVHVFGGFTGSETRMLESAPEVNRTVIDGSTSRGGAPAFQVVLARGEDILLRGFTVSGGRAVDSPLDRIDVGAGLNVSHSRMRVEKCLFQDNSAALRGGALLVGSSTATFVDCIFTENTAGSRGGICYSTAGSSIRFESCIASNNTALGGAAVYSRGGELFLDKCTFYDNAATLTGRSEAPSVVYCNGDASITNSIFYSNTSAADEGETLLFRGPSDPEAQDWPTVNVTNCTFYGNNDSARDAAIRYSHLVDWTVRNCIFVEHRGWAIQGGGAPGQLLYSDIQGPLPWPTSGPDQPRFLTVEGLIDRDPDFSDAENGDFRLRSFSPCIDTGTAEGAPSSDIRGVPRPIGAGFDLGAYEYLEPDADGDGVTNAVDVQLVINAALGVAPPGTQADVSGDGKVNAVDVQIVINAALGLYG